MSWGITFSTEVYISKKDYRTKWEVESAIKDLRDSISNIESELKMLAISSPRDIVPEEFTDRVEFVHGRVSVLLYDLEDYHTELNNLLSYNAYLEEGNEIVKSE